MKSIKVIVFLTLFLSPLLVTKSMASDDAMLLATALCEYTKSNQRSKIRKKLKRFKVKLRTIYKDTTCNGKSLHQFAKDNNAEDVVKYYETKIKPDKL